MTGHAAHAAIELAAAVVLVLTGALFLAVAAHQRRVVALGVPTGTGPGTTPIERPLALSIPVAVAVALSLGAAAIHLAAGPSHVEELGDLGLGFYWAALFQAGWAVAYAVRRSHAVAWVGIVGNVAIVGAWLGSRTLGLPVGSEPWRPEAIGVPDLTTVIFQGILVGILAFATIGSRRSSVPRRTSRSGAAGLVAGVPIVGILFLATTLAVASAAGGHGHGEPSPHGMDPVAGAHAAP